MSSLPDFLAEFSKDVPEVLKQTVLDAAECRAAIQTGVSEDDPVEFHTYLVKNRSLIERLEYLTSSLVLLKSRTDQAVQHRKGEYDDAYMKAASKPKVGFDDYTSAKEKDAQFNAAATEELYALRKAEAMHRDVYAAWDYCRILLRGAEGAQRDLETRIRLITLTSQLER